MKKHIISIALLFSVLQLSIAKAEENTEPKAPQVTEEYRTAAYRLFKAFELDNEYQSMIRTTINRGQMYEPDIPIEFWDQLKSQFNEKEFFDKLAELYIEIFELEDIKELTRFYESAVYKKLSYNSAGFMIKTGKIQDEMYVKMRDKMVSAITEKGYPVPGFMKPSTIIEEEQIPEQNK